ncbi:hypothetical protein, partial [Eubacterium barkeri]|uniref:hypothetical protein n=1 Tax=Eubacterium barkeri TaxID=1528 RepID=UPI001A9A3344
ILLRLSHFLLLFSILRKKQNQRTDGVVSVSWFVYALRPTNCRSHVVLMAGAPGFEPGARGFGGIFSMAKKSFFYAIY